MMINDRFGKLRIRLSGRDAGNNGVKSLNATSRERFDDA